MRTSGTTEWYGDYAYAWGADGQLWLHCPKSNNKEKAWRLESEVVQDAAMLAEIRAKIEAEEAAKAARSQHVSKEDEPKLLFYMGVATWGELRELAFKKAQKVTDSKTGKAPCLACPARNCDWTSKGQDWNSSEHSVDLHVVAKTYTEAGFRKSRDPAERYKITHPGDDWLAQSNKGSRYMPSYEGHEWELEAAGMGLPEGEKKEEEWGPKPPKFEPKVKHENRQHWGDEQESEREKKSHRSERESRKGERVTPGKGTYQEWVDKWNKENPEETVSHVAGSSSAFWGSRWSDSDDYDYSEPRHEKDVQGWGSSKKKGDDRRMGWVKKHK